MKKLLILLLALGMLATVGACGIVPTESSSSLSSSVHSSGGESSLSQENSSDEKPGKVNVTFKQSGCVDIVKKVNKGETLTDVPAPAEKTGYTVTWDTFTGFSASTLPITPLALSV